MQSQKERKRGNYVSVEEKEKINWKHLCGCVQKRAYAQAAVFILVNLKIIFLNKKKHKMT